MQALTLYCRTRNMCFVIIALMLFVIVVLFTRSEHMKMRLLRITPAGASSWFEQIYNVMNQPTLNWKLNNTPGVPVVYEEELDLRLIVITHNRKTSVMKLLWSLQELELDGDKAALEIWVDPKADGTVHNETLEAVNNFKWIGGPTRVHVQEAHVGILGQWIDTWRPINAPPFSRNPETIAVAPFIASKYREMALILEDDLNISSQAYRFLKAVHKKYNGRPDYAGTSLQSDEIWAHNTRRHLAAPSNESAFMYVCIGTWGFAPAPKMWAEFQDWYHQIRSSPNASQFHPHVPNAQPTNWFKSFEASGTQDSMWEMWFIYFTHIKKALTAFSNLEAVNNNDRKSCVSLNRREVGLHYPSKGAENLCKLLDTWNASYVDMIPDEPVKFDWNGNIMPQSKL